MGWRGDPARELSLGMQHSTQRYSSPGHFLPRGGTPKSIHLLSLTYLVGELEPGTCVCPVLTSLPAVSGATCLQEAPSPSSFPSPKFKYRLDSQGEGGSTLGGNLLMQAASTAHTLGGHLLGKERHLGESESARTEVWAGPDCWVFFFCQVLFLYWLWP
jgi:hypothetical protein